MNTKIFIILLLGLITFYSCSESNKKYITLRPYSTSTQPKDSSITENSTKHKEKITDTLVLNLDNDNVLETVVITEGYYEMDNFKFDVYKNNYFIGSLFSQQKYPWLDSLENEPNSCGILWESHYLNGSDCSGDAYYGYILEDNKLKHVISIPDTYYGCYSIGAPKRDPFYWGNIQLTKVKYNCKTSVEVTVALDLHKSPSWEQMDSINRVMYDKKHTLNYSWISDQEKYLIKSRIKKDTSYSIETVYDMTEYLENEFRLKWP